MQGKSVQNVSDRSRFVMADACGGRIFVRTAAGGGVEYGTDADVRSP